MLCLHCSAFGYVSHESPWIGLAQSPECAASERAEASNRWTYSKLLVLVSSRVMVRVSWGGGVAGWRTEHRRPGLSAFLCRLKSAYMYTSDSAAAFCCFQKNAFYIRILLHYSSSCFEQGTSWCCCCVIANLYEHAGAARIIYG